MQEKGRNSEKESARPSYRSPNQGWGHRERARAQGVLGLQTRRLRGGDQRRKVGLRPAKLLSLRPTTPGNKAERGRRKLMGEKDFAKGVPF